MPLPRFISLVSLVAMVAVACQSSPSPEVGLPVASTGAKEYVPDIDFTEYDAPEGRTPKFRPRRDAPNILLIVTDDQRGGLGVMKDTQRLIADQGVYYPHTYATTPTCCPSRTSIMTGKYAHNHKVVNNFHASEIDQETTLQRYLHAAGYNTALFGKYLNRWEDDIPYFDVWAANNANQRYYNGYWYTSEGEEGTIATYSTSYIKTRAKGFLEEAETRDRKPWFLYLAPMAPHHPFTPEARYVNTPVPYLAKSPAQKERNRSDKPEYVRSQHSNPKRDRQVRRKQLRTLKSVDDMIASVFRTLRRAKETRDTLVFFISDNGFLWGDHLMSRKAVPYTPSIRLEFMARWPGHLPSGKIDKRIAANVDIAPTVAEAVGFPARIRSKMDGRSLFIPNGRDHALMEYEAEASSLDPNKPRKHPPTWASIRTRDYQYIENYGLDGETVRFREFYDLKKDPFQLRNALRDERKENNPSRKLIRSLHRQLARERHCKGTTGTRACP